MSRINPLVTKNQTNGLEIAIIGMSGRFPKANTIEKFWENQKNGVESISFFNDKELIALGVESALLDHPQYVRAAGVLENIELFDASFFGFSAKEAEITDPQHRLFLECAWEALEQAGYDAETYRGAIGVYAGTGLNGYMLKRYAAGSFAASVDPYQLVISNDKDFLTTRVSYKLNLEGTSVDIQTACSTSLVAVHMACRSLLGGECHLALAGGVSISESSGYLYQEGSINSPDGHCRAFDAKAQGTVRGSGVGIVVLKRLKNALADGDTIHAVIKGSATNNDGSFKVSYTAPRIDSQAKVIRKAQAIAEVEPDTITYVEAHGTGTSLGDPIEIAALTQAFRVKTQQKQFCAIGSVKTNIGHLDAAAGVAGLIKTVLALEHKQIPPSLHFEKPNPKIDFATSPFYVNTQLAEWKTNGTPRRAGVSSFGIGGTNAHVILEEAPPIEVSDSSRPWQLLFLSAKTSTALDTATVNLVNYLQHHPDCNLADVAYTLQVGRRGFEHRRMVICQNSNDATQALSSPDSQQVLSHYQELGHRSLVFMFPGQGTQYVNMARELYHTELAFTEQVDRCCELLKPHLGLDLRQVLYPDEEPGVRNQESGDQSNVELQAPNFEFSLNDTIYAQPALFVIEYAFAKLWMSWGVNPTAMIGHSIGEYVAACLAGVFSLEDALALVATRGRLMQQCPLGAMLAVQCSEQQIQPLLGAALSLAGSNAPSSCVVSGPTEAVEQLQQKLQEQNISCRRLHTSHAFHSEMMEPILQPFTQALQGVKLNPPTIPFISNLSGTWMTPSEAIDPHYWTQQLRQPVCFSAGIREVLTKPKQILLEVGPGRTLSTFAKQHQPDELVTLTSVRHLKEQKSDIAVLLTTLGRLWLMGVKVDWAVFYAHERRHRLPLPTYPFERQRYWIDLQKQPQRVAAPFKEKSKSRKLDIADWFYLPFWKPALPPVLLDQDELHQSSCILVFLDECGLGSQIVTNLQQQNHEIITVSIGSHFTQWNEKEYSLNPQQQEDYHVLFKALLKHNQFPTKIIHSWTVTSHNFPNLGFEQVNKLQDLGFYSLLFLAQALGKQAITDDVQITVISNQMQSVTGGEPLCPEKATVLGPVRVISREYPNLHCRSIDVEFPIPEHWQVENLAEQLLAELTTPSPDLVIAYRGRQRWVQAFEPVRFDRPPARTVRLKPGGVYLITGGLGGIGLTLAQHLAKTVQAKLILIGRSAFPPREAWQHWLTTHDEQDKISCKIQIILELEALGSEVQIISADVTQFEQMQAVVDQSCAQFGQINGVIHAAGVPGGGVIQRKTPDEVERILAPKVKGTRILEAVFKDIPLDFLVLCSSLTSIQGGFGQVDYCAANAFLDVFAHHHFLSSSHRSVFSINWDAWQEVGMAVDTTVPFNLQAWRAETLQQKILPQEGAEVFDRLLGRTIPQVVVSTCDFLTQIEQENAGEDSNFLETLEKVNLSKPTHPRPELNNPYVAPRNELEQTLAEIWQELLGVELVGIYDNFLDLGGDSLLTVQVRSKMRDRLHQDFPIADLFEYPTISALAEHLSQEIAKRPVFQHAQDRAKQKQVAIQNNQQRMKQRRKPNG
ncbi:type I polyketide synthase [Halomicronema hongdechloris C2206]|uniref:Type I polyketide synthase n=1 Tax=Halomicronema hongdechloris C2206 TaxID=1641165 RepID=A0A1Z3HL57_9CYAN|nr:type I polyketide synthase [Halomicronema hongdechloris]ASC71030.1 type I polyketide synthase [Halomicronema hongdechloris C2206]